MVQEVSFNELEFQTGPRINKFKFAEQEKSWKKRIFFLPKIFRDTAHFKDGFGFFACLSGNDKKDKNPSGICPACQAGQSAGIKTFTRYGLHVVTYSTNPDGTIKSPFGYDVKCLIKNEKSFTKIWDLFKLYGNDEKGKPVIFSGDFIIGCDNVQYQNYTYNFIPTCLWKQQANAKEILEDIKSKVKEFDLSKIIAPEISLKTMEDLIAGRIPNRYETKNKPEGQAATADPRMEFPPKDAAPYVPPATAKPAVSVGSASKSDLDILEELSAN